MIKLAQKLINKAEVLNLLKKVKEKNKETKKKLKQKLLQFQKITIQEKEYQHLYLINLIY